MRFAVRIRCGLSSIWPDQARLRSCSLDRIPSMYKRNCQATPHHVMPLRHLTWLSKPPPHSPWDFMFHRELQVPYQQPSPPPGTPFNVSLNARQSRTGPNLGIYQGDTQTPTNSYIAEPSKISWLNDSDWGPLQIVNLYERFNLKDVSHCYRWGLWYQVFDNTNLSAWRVTIGAFLAMRTSGFESVRYTELWKFTYALQLRKPDLYKRLFYFTAQLASKLESNFFPIPLVKLKKGVSAYKMWF